MQPPPPPSGGQRGDESPPPNHWERELDELHESDLTMGDPHPPVGNDIFCMWTALTSVMADQNA